ncbi:MAG: T9SS type A sorting domain-containing protein, partial [Ignavibacteriota bacterium]
DSLKNCNITFMANEILGTTTLGSVLQAQRRPLMQAPSAVETNIGNALTVSNYPNPVSSETKFSYTLNARTPVSLSVFDVLGREIAQVVNTTQDAGTYNVNFDASKLSSGSYTYILNAGGKSINSTMTVAK